MNEDILFSRHQSLGIITLNRQGALNALTLPMVKAMQQQLIEWQKDSGIAAVVLQAKPGKAFCAGGDVRWLYEAGLENDPKQMEFFEHEYRLNHYIHHFSKPYISLMDGITMGGGVGVSLHGSFPVASEQFVFAMPETGIGFFPDIGASYLLARCSGGLGMYLGLTGQRLSANDAVFAGLVKYQIRSEMMPEVIPRLAALDLFEHAHERINACFQSMAQETTSDMSFEHKALIDDCFTRTGVNEILEALKQYDNPFADNLYQKLQKKAPLSLKVTFEQIQRARTLSLGECLKMDYVLVRHFMEDHDFYEGVRALLIEKDKTPHWDPADLDNISEAQVIKYFEGNANALDFTNP